MHLCLGLSYYCGKCNLSFCTVRPGLLASVCVLRCLEETQAALTKLQAFQQRQSAAQRQEYIVNERGGS